MYWCLLVRYFTKLQDVFIGDTPINTNIPDIPSGDKVPQSDLLNSQMLLRSYSLPPCPPPQSQSTNPVKHLQNDNATAQQQAHNQQVNQFNQKLEQLHQQYTEQYRATHGDAVEDTAKCVNINLNNEQQYLGNLAHTYTNNTATAYNNKRYIQRKDAIIATLNNPQYCFNVYQINEIGAKLLWEHSKTFGSSFNLFCGNQLQHTIHNECVDIINDVADYVADNHVIGNLRDITEAILDYTILTRELNEEGHCYQAIKAVDVSWSLLDYTKALGRACCNSLYTCVKPIIHPIDTICECSQTAAWVATNMFELWAAYDDMKWALLCCSKKDFGCHPCIKIKFIICEMCTGKKRLPQ